MPELLSIHGRCPRCSQVLTVPAGKLQSVFRCARCQYRVLGSALMEEARLSPPRLAAAPAGPVVRPFDEDPDDQHTRLHLPATDADEEAETALPAQLVADSPDGSRSVSAPPLRRFEEGQDDAEDQQTRLHVGGDFQAPRPAPRRAGRHATLLGVPSPGGLSRFGAEPEDGDDQATRLHLGGELGAFAPTQGHTTRGIPAPPVFPGMLPGGAVPDARRSVPAPPPPEAAPAAAALQRFEALAEDDDQNTRLHVPIAYEEEALGDAREAAEARASSAPGLRPSGAPQGAEARASAPPELRAPLAPALPRLSLAPEVPAFAGGAFGRATLQLSRWIDDWVRERHSVLLVTLAALCAIIAPVFDVLLGSRQQGATVIAANLALFFLWALGFAWLGRLRNDADVWDHRVAVTRITTGARLALADLQSVSSLPMPLRWRLTAELSGALGLGGLALASLLTVTHLVLGWPVGTSLLFLWRLFVGSCVVLAVIAAREAASVPAGLSPAPDVTAPAVARFPAVIDLSLPLTVPSEQAATPLHQLLEVLSSWSPREWPNQDSYIAALERHLLRHMGWARVERERPLGLHGGAHLIVDEALLIEVVRGFDADIAERVVTRMRRHARTWRGRPALIVVFEASRAELLAGEGAQLLEALHQSYPMLAVRMPSTQ